MNAPANIYLSTGQCRMLDVATYIEALKQSEFCMAYWVWDDGRPSCLAGHTAWLALHKEHPVAEADRRFAELTTWHDVAAEYLGMDQGERQIAELFMPNRSDLFPRDGYGCVLETTMARERVSRQWAARCLRHLAMTGEVDWQGTRKQTEEAGPWKLKELL